MTLKTICVCDSCGRAVDVRNESGPGPHPLTPWGTLTVNARSLDLCPVCVGRLDGTEVGAVRVLERHG